MMKRLPSALIVVVLAITLLTLNASCKGGSEVIPGQEEGQAGSENLPSPQGELTAHEAYLLLKNFARYKWAEDAIIFYLETTRDGQPLQEGRCGSWSAGIYSPTKKEAYKFNLADGNFYQARSPLFRDKDWKIGDWLGGLPLDSPDAAKKAEELGAGKIMKLRVCVSDPDSPAEASLQTIENCRVYWEIRGNDGIRVVFLDAESGEQLKVPVPTLDNGS